MVRHKPGKVVILLLLLLEDNEKNIVASTNTAKGTGAVIIQTRFS